MAVEVDTLKQGSVIPLKFHSDESVNDLGFAIKYHYSSEFMQSERAVYSFNRETLRLHK